MSAQPVTYWTKSAREQNRWYVQLRRQARLAMRCRDSGRLYDEARRCRDRRDAFLATARYAAQLVRS